MDETPHISLTGLCKSFNHQPVLEHINLTAHRGDVLVLIGASGSGKSTLLRCLNLLTQPDSGTLNIAGLSFEFKQDENNNIRHHTLMSLRSKVGMVFQQYNLWPHLTILQNLMEAPIYVRKLDPKIAKTRAQTLLTNAGIADKQDEYPAALSGGEQQRAAIARALMMEPEILLFDEPTSALDPERVTEVLKTLQHLAQQGITMVIATHEIKFAREAADEVIFLRDGAIWEQGPAHILFEHPNTPELSRFLGQ